MHDINEQTYVPGTCTFPSDCPCLLVYKTEHPKFFKIHLRLCQKDNFNHFFPYLCHMFLTFFFPTLCFSSCFTFCFTTTHNSIVSGLYNHPMCNFDTFLCPNSPKLKRNWQTVLILSGFHAILTFGKPNINQACLDTTSLYAHWSPYLSNSSMTPLSGHAIGHHATWILIIPRSLIIISGNK